MVILLHSAIQPLCRFDMFQGTLDALWSDDDKEAMLRQCARILAPPYGVIASISFATRARLQLLGRLCPQLGLSWRVHVVGSGDPARGHEVKTAATCFTLFSTLHHVIRQQSTCHFVGCVFLFVGGVHVVQFSCSCQDCVATGILRTLALMPSGPFPDTHFKGLWAGPVHPRRAVKQAAGAPCGHRQSHPGPR